MKDQTKFYSVNKNGYQITKNDPAVFTNWSCFIKTVI